MRRMERGAVGGASIHLDNFLIQKSRKREQETLKRFEAQSREGSWATVVVCGHVKKVS
jgi:hypothetical protein